MKIFQENCSTKADCLSATLLSGEVDIGVIRWSARAWEDCALTQKGMSIFLDTDVNLDTIV